jgi:hypothetical protein
MAGTRYPASPVAAKWIAYLLEYERVINKGDILKVSKALSSTITPKIELPTINIKQQYLLALMLGNADFYLLAGCNGSFQDVNEQATYDEVVLDSSSIIVVLGKTLTQYTRPSTRIPTSSWRSKERTPA